MGELQPEYDSRSQTTMRHMQYKTENTAIKAEAIVTKKHTHKAICNK